MTASDNNWSNKRLSSTPSDIKSWHYLGNLPHAGQSTTKECAVWLYGRSTMQRKTDKAVVGQHHWLDWSEYRRCCEDDTRSWCLEKLRFRPQGSMTMSHDDDEYQTRPFNTMQTLISRIAKVGLFCFTGSTVAGCPSWCRQLLIWVPEGVKPGWLG